ncbi:MAG: MerC domain-containing protein [Rubricoccaceae bacterium]|nr:MerC domain-containing protein [Rubricoccaceae bacterium]
MLRPMLSVVNRVSFARRLSSDRWDQLGVVLSGLCAVHCLVLPIMLLALPVWNTVHFVHEAAHPIMAGLVLPVTLKALRNNPCGTPLLLRGLGLIWIAIPVHAFVGETAGLLLTLVGSAMLIVGHRGNMQCRKTA